MRACLIDVFETVLTFDVSAHTTAFPEFLAVDTDEWNEAIAGSFGAMTGGRLSLREAYAATTARVGVDASLELIDSLVELDRALLIDNCVVFEEPCPSCRSSGRVVFRPPS